MKKLFGIVCIVLCFIVSGCSGGGRHDPIPTPTTTPTITPAATPTATSIPSPTATPTIIFQENFDSHPIGDWCPNRMPEDPYWRSDDTWEICDEGEGDHSLQNKWDDVDGAGYMTRTDSFFYDGTISIKMSYKYSPFSFYIGGRSSYALRMDSGHTLAIWSYASERNIAQTSFAFMQDTEYTFSLTFNGSNIIGQVTDGNKTATVTATDIICRAGNVQFWYKSGNNDPIINFDDFVITKP